MIYLDVIIDCHVDRFAVYVRLYPVMWNNQRNMDEECAFYMIDPKAFSFYKGGNFRIQKTSPLLKVDTIGSRL
jgi:hypothetical protein